MDALKLVHKIHVADTFGNQSDSCLLVTVWTASAQIVTSIFVHLLIWLFAKVFVGS